MRYLLSITILFLLVQSCCKYGPFVNSPVLRDFERKNYNFANNQLLVDNDSLEIKLSATINIPIKCRSKKLKLFYCNLQLNIIKNLFLDTLWVKLNENSQLTCDDGRSILIGEAKIVNDASDTYLVISKNKYYISQNGLKSDSITYIFNYDFVKGFNYQNQELKINYGYLHRFIGSDIKTNKIVGFYHD